MSRFAAAVANIGDASDTRGPGARGIELLSPGVHRIQRNIALAVMLLPALGSLEALRLLITGQLGTPDLILFGAMYFVHMGGVTMGLHRMVAHRAFEAGPVVKSILLAMGCTAAQGPILYWVSTHRAHHAYSDHEGDPHSPHRFGTGMRAKLKGLWFAHMPWMLAPTNAQWKHFSRDVLADRQLMFFQRTYFYWMLLGFAIPTGAGYLIHGDLMGAWIGLMVGGFARMFLANQAAWAVGSLSHMVGGRPFKTNDESANNWAVAIVAFGEGLQNNHHAFPNCYRHSIRWYEPDFSGWCLMAMRAVGLIQNPKFPSEASIRKARVGAAPRAIH